MAQIPCLDSPRHTNLAEGQKGPKGGSEGPLWGAGPAGCPGGVPGMIPFNWGPGVPFGGALRRFEALARPIWCQGASGGLGVPSGGGWVPGPPPI